MILIIDNYDSFTYNIFQAVSTLDPEVVVIRNDGLTPDELEKMQLSHMVVSPGPGRPEGAGVSKEAIRRMAGKIPILGVCLGHQAIGEVFGGEVVRASRIMHGKSSAITHGGDGIFEGLPVPFEAIRYHSLALSQRSIPETLEVTATADDGEVMGVRHRRMTVEGVQFHPESFGSPGGIKIFRNFLKLKGGVRHDA
ncbi:MAG TPA: aminodeoxychorismate/anthranilate synthase component II [Proteobacteria bacterium]|nr:aminodeoxychorismate/anthranilate synthase component 2 [bacterium BMS3Abin14]HDL53594.1 aminodeoxychorismate/anthranilate synthase component II [Pseudomonadota bacterium]